MRRALSGLAVALVTLAGCGPNTNSPAPGDVDGHYTGEGGYVAAINFDVSDGGATIANFKGFITPSCSAGGSNTSFPQFSLDDPEPIDIARDGGFSTTYQPDGSATTFDLRGGLDGHGGASGTVSMRGGACASITAPWSASLQGVSRPPLPTVTATPDDTRQCTPQPCAVVGNLQVDVQGLRRGTLETGAPGLLLDFTITNTNSSGSFGTFSQSNLKLNDGTHPAVGPGLGLGSMTLSTGEVVACTHDFDLQPGQTSDEQHLCYPQGDLDASGPIRLDFTWVEGHSSIDLGVAAD